MRLVFSLWVLSVLAGMETGASGRHASRLRALGGGQKETDSLLVSMEEAKKMVRKRSQAC